MLDADSPDGLILIASDSVAEASLITDLLTEFKQVRTSTDPANAVADYDAESPDILVLGFDTLAKAEQYCLSLMLGSNTVHVHPHRTLVLCTAEQLPEAYEHCREGKFDDYVFFWPLTLDSTRLAMSIHLAFKALEVERNSSPTAADFAAKAGRLTAMEPMVENQLEQGQKFLQAACAMMAQAEVSMDAAFDGLSSQLASGQLSEFVEVKDAEKLDRALTHMKEDRILQPLATISQAMVPLLEWAMNFRRQMQPHVRAARSLGSMAQKVTPVILVVDDDSIHRALLRNILTEERYRVVVASSGREALAALARTTPSLVLMDIMMPGIDGLETMAQIKAIPIHANLPVIMVTAKSDGNVVRDSLRIGAVDFIVKPVRPVALLAKVARALRAGERLATV